MAESPGTLVSWENGIGDDKKYHIAHVSPEGITLVSKMKDHKQWEHLVATAENSPSEASELLQQHEKAKHFAPNGISKVTYSETLWQLSIFDKDDNKTVVPEGKQQKEVFAAIKQDLGGTKSEEEVDAWAVMQGPLFILAVIAVIGGFFIYFTTICEPDYEAGGRRAGMKQLMNWIGYKIGPVWTSVGVGSLAAITLGGMTYQLIKRPTREILEYSS